MPKVNPPPSTQVAFCFHMGSLKKDENLLLNLILKHKQVLQDPHELNNSDIKISDIWISNNEAELMSENGFQVPKSPPLAFYKGTEALAAE